MTTSSNSDEKLEQISDLLEEVANDNTAVRDAMNRMGEAQHRLDTDLVRELGQLRDDLSDMLVHRALKDLCTELIAPMAAMESMLDRADFSDPDVIEGHLRSLTVTLRSVLNRMGAEKVTLAVGEDLFDPNRHRCAAKLDPDESPFPNAAPRTVVRVIEDGYVLGGRVLRPPVVEIQARPGNGATSD